MKDADEAITLKPLSDGSLPQGSDLPTIFVESGSKYPLILCREGASEENPVYQCQFNFSGNKDVEFENISDQNNGTITLTAKFIGESDTILQIPLQHFPSVQSPQLKMSVVDTETKKSLNDASLPNTAMTSKSNVNLGDKSHSKGVKNDPKSTVGRNKKKRARYRKGDKKKIKIKKPTMA
jgi:hypothetical protein